MIEIKRIPFKSVDEITKDMISNIEKSINDQTIKADYGKAKLSLVPRRIIWNIAAIREYGVTKYGSSENWKAVDIQRYRDAAYRHFMQYLDNPKGTDTESGLPSLWHLACNIAFLCELEDFGNDDG